MKAKQNKCINIILFILPKKFMLISLSYYYMYILSVKGNKINATISLPTKEKVVLTI